MSRSPTPLVLALGLLSASASRAVAPPIELDFERCASVADDGGPSVDLTGSVRFELLVRADGQVYAGYVQREKGFAARKIERCILYRSMLWQLPPARLDYTWPVVATFLPRTVHGRTESPQDENEIQAAGCLLFTGSGCSDESHRAAQRIYEKRGLGAAFRDSSPARVAVVLQDFDKPPPREPTDLFVARATLEISDRATAAERGTAELAVAHDAEARSLFREALAANPADPLALRGLAQALAHDPRNAAEARALALQLVALSPASAQGHEALLRVCLSVGDDRCAFDEFQSTKAAADLSLRSLALRDELLAPAQAAAARLRLAASGRAPGPGGDGGLCTAEAGLEQETLCIVKRCFDDETQLYAQKLAVQDHEALSPGDWRLKPAGAGRIVVLRPLGTRTAVWLSSDDGKSLVIRPSNTEARQIMLASSRCALAR